MPLTPNEVFFAIGLYIFIVLLLFVIGVVVTKINENRPIVYCKDCLHFISTSETGFDYDVCGREYKEECGYLVHGDKSKILKSLRSCSSERACSCGRNPIYFKQRKV